MDVKVNDSDWSSMSTDEQNNLKNVVSAYFKDAQIVPDPSVPSSSSKSAVPLSGGLNISNPFCKGACDIAEAAAIAACAAVGGPIAVAACIAAAKVAGDACRDAC